MVEHTPLHSFIDFARTFLYNVRTGNLIAIKSRDTRLPGPWIIQT